MTERPGATDYCVAYVETDESRKPLSCEAAPAFGNPIYPSSGTKRESVDLRLRSGGLGLSLSYDSTPRAPLSTANESLRSEALDRAFGDLWHGTFHRRLMWTADDLGLLALRGDGRVVTFTREQGVYKTDSDVPERLRQDALGRTVIEDPAAQLLETYDASGRLVLLTRLDGRVLRLTYSDASTPLATAPGSGYLIAVEDDSGRRLSFVYTLPPNGRVETDGRVTQVMDAAGTSVNITYDDRGNLAGLQWQDGTSRRFLYENAALPWALTGSVDELGQRLSTYGWDAAGRAVSTARAGDTGSYSVTYQQPPSIEVLETFDTTNQVVRRTRRWTTPTGISVRQPNGTAVSLSATNLLGAARVTSRSQPAGSGCAASTRNVSYDVQGNLAVRDDFNGNRTCFSHDARNLLRSRVEGLENAATCSALTADGARLPSAARKTTLSWHPEWQLPVRQAEPGRITTWVYHGQPDPFASNAIATCAPAGSSLLGRVSMSVLCKMVVQATTDASGEKGLSATLGSSVPMQVASWTYDGAGRVLSTKDTLGNTTTYAYYTTSSADYRVGDLASVTNAKGQLTRFTRYDAHGNLLQSVDANGDTTDFLYDARQRLVRHTIAGLSTEYAYLPTGRLSRVTRADGSWLSYTYDGAHRMTAVSDRLGNRLDYSLDANGQVIQETSRDPQGALAAQLNLVRDALGRVQLSTGRE
jgi:YD repeat-containing protein